MLNPLRSVRARLLAAMAAVMCGLLLFGGGLAYAHNGGTFNIWASGVFMWSGATNHYNTQFYWMEWDFMIPLEEEVYQPQPGSFYWTRFKIGQGVEFNPPAWLGDAFVFRGDGTYYWDTDYFFCKRVGGQTYTYWPGSAPYNSSSYGGWEQWSGAGDASCYGSYIAKDWQFVQAQQ